MEAWPFGPPPSRTWPRPVSKQEATMPRPRRVTAAFTFPKALPRPSREHRLGAEGAQAGAARDSPTALNSPADTPVHSARHARPPPDRLPVVGRPFLSRPGSDTDFLCSGSGAASPEWVRRAHAPSGGSGRPFPCCFKLLGSSTFLSLRPQVILTSASVVVSPHASDSPASFQ